MLVSRLVLDLLQCSRPGSRTSTSPTSPSFSEPALATNAFLGNIGALLEHDSWAMSLLEESFDVLADGRRTDGSVGRAGKGQTSALTTLVPVASPSCPWGMPYCHLIILLALA